MYIKNKKQSGSTGSESVLAPKAWPHKEIEESGSEIQKETKPKKHIYQEETLQNTIRTYQRYLKLQGRSTKDFRYALGYLFRFASNYSELHYLSYNQAQSFQSYLIEEHPQLSSASICNIIGLVSGFYDYLEQQGMIANNPFTLIDRIKVPQKLPSWIPNEKEMARLLEALSHFTNGDNLRAYKKDYRAHILCELLYATGMRISEAAALKLEDINLEDATLLIHDVKTRSQRTGFLNDYVRRILQIYIKEFRNKSLSPHKKADPRRLFGSKRNLKQWLNSILKEKCQELGMMQITTHQFRHAFGYHMLRAGCDIRSIQAFLGHRRLNSTGVYTKVDKQALRNILDRHHPRSDPRSGHR